VVVTASIFFFPGGLDPVLDGGPRDEDPVVAPQLPLGALIGQPVLDDDPDGEVLDAAGVLALGQGQIGGAGGEEEVTLGAVMPGDGEDDIDGAARTQVAQVVQGARGRGLAPGTRPAARAASRLEIAAALFDPGLGQVLDAVDALRRVGHVFPWSVHDCALLSQPPPYLHFTHAGPDSPHSPCYSVGR
jgi:hypothetical protein